MADTAELSAITQVSEVSNSLSSISSITQVSEISNSLSSISSVTAVFEVSPEGASSVVPDITGAPGVAATFDGSASNTDRFIWEFTSVPSGSALATPGPVPYPDDGAGSPIDMTDNEALYHYNGNGSDSSGNSRNLTLHNTPTFVSGQIADAISLNGTDQYGESVIPIGTTGTIATWFRFNSTPANGDHIVGFGVLGSSTDGSWRSISVLTSSGLSLSFFGRNADIYNFATVETGRWYHCAVTWDASGSVSCYVDGVLIITQTKTLVTPDTTFSVGGRQNAGTYYSHVDVDETAVWSRVLSATEIADIYAKQIQIAGFVDLGLTSAGSATLYPDNGVSSPVDMTNNGALFHLNGTLADTSGNNNSLNTNGISFAGGFDGTANGSLKFAGSASTAILRNTVSMAGDWTAAFWFYNLRPNTAWRTGLRGSNTDHQIIVESGSNRLGVYANGNGNFRPCGFDMNSTTYQGWHHIAAVGSGTTTTFYVNGVSVGSSDRKSADNFYSIGNYQFGTQPFADRIDEFAAWTRALSASEIAGIYSLQSAGKVSATSSATFTPDVVGTYSVRLATTKNGYSDNAIASAAISESSGLPGRGLSGDSLAPSTLPFTAHMPGSLLPGG